MGPRPARYPRLKAAVNVAVHASRAPVGAWAVLLWRCPLSQLTDALRVLDRQARQGYETWVGFARAFPEHVRRALLVYRFDRVVSGHWEK